MYDHMVRRQTAGVNMLMQHLAPAAAFLVVAATARAQSCSRLPNVRGALEVGRR
jgi:hypothetical protein